MNQLDKLREDGRIGLDGSPGDETSRWAAEAITHLTAELVRMTMNTANLSRELIVDPIPFNIASDANCALAALDKYGDKHQIDRTTALTYVREDVAKALPTHAT